MSNTLILGHRGSSGSAPENTMEAFELSIKQGADGVELDVQRTSDGVLVVTHDEEIDRVSDGKGEVQSYTYSQLKEFNFSNNYPELKKHQIPTLAEVLDLFRNTGKIVNIELKNSMIFYEGMEDEVIAVVKDLNMEDQVIYSSFNLNSVKYLTDVQKKSLCGILYTDPLYQPAYYTSIIIGANAIHPRFHNIDIQNYMEEARNYNLMVNTWTVNEEKDLINMLNKKVSSIITNYPERALKLRKEIQGK